MSEGPPAAASAKMKADLIAVIPNLRAFAVSLCGNPDRADDLVQETLVKAWSNLGSFVEGTNLPAWLFTPSMRTLGVVVGCGLEASTSKLAPPALKLALISFRKWTARKITRSAKIATAIRVAVCVSMPGSFQ